MIHRSDSLLPSFSVSPILFFASDFLSLSLSLSLLFLSEGTLFAFYIFYRRERVFFLLWLKKKKKNGKLQFIPS